ncbi:sensor histidine kinase [Fibrivirga algicola]|uniref:histidine kinase n=1 Tax=Fibrivirga algicola TaxID=2950420 RepID=A0ABX0QFQ0_9BACT|nr:HAMP domain-containing sensor histidine kinase [Fibrivirga algicola]ARK08927.1 two-component sensor histidine kinase [Fibrella sp. ES10-3-2-2]NID08894.1 HAMP domain-containing histidine kinase [Fibrivirga algicola]
MNNIATYVLRNWYYGLLIIAAFGLSTWFSTEIDRLGWYVWAASAALLLTVCFLIWRHSREHNMPYVHKEVLDTIVHEFQTPISAIKMAADILATPFGRSSQERTDKYIHIIQEETQRLQQQVDVMLSLARADRDRLAINVDAVNLHELIKSIAERHGPYLKLRLQATQPILMADRLHLTNVLHNLLDNAVKYSPGEPELIIQTEGDRSCLMVAVIDRGLGIPKHLQRKVFKPFYRVSENNQGSVKGFGLGLSYVQRIVEAHAWHLELVSEVGKGSEFKIRCPKTSMAPTIHLAETRT